ncbi:MAG: hypothetical protein HYS40_06120 [Gemmatimonadetes bacterium]|nr:hypothetical protein [Gemmatimonadota bacterium]
MLARPVQILAAQARYRVINDGEWFYQEASGKRLARVARGAVVTAGSAQGDWIRVTLEGWIFATSVGPAPQAGFDLTVTRAPEENLRSAPAGALVAKLTSGFLLTRLAEQRPEGSLLGRPWVHVKRDGWMRRRGLQAVGQVASTSTANVADPSQSGMTPGRRPEGNPPDSSSVPPDPARVQPARPTTLYRAPDGPAAGTITPETPLRVLDRTGEWSRVQFEGWVKTADLRTAPPGVLVGVSAAELRADPQRYLGQTLRWDLQFIAVQTADDLRPDIPEGATYLLTRGPLPERGFVYVVVPDAQQIAIATLTPLAIIQVTARVRAGRSRFLGNPVVDLVSLETQP